MNPENKVIYRITYEKCERVKYISHLDFIRCWGRAFKRAKIPVKYSNGFNPHILLNIALPCPVGVSSSCEMLDIALTQRIDCEEFKNRMTAALPDAVKVVRVEENVDMKDFYDILSASYTVEFNSSSKINLDDFNSAENVMIEKKSKRKVNEVNIKDFIRNIEISESNGTNHRLKLHINAGNFSNLKPELVIKSMEMFFDCKATDIKIERKEIYFDDMTKVC